MPVAVDLINFGHRARSASPVVELDAGIPVPVQPFRNHRGGGRVATMTVDQQNFTKTTAIHAVQRVLYHPDIGAQSE